MVHQESGARMVRCVLVSFALAIVGCEVSKPTAPVPTSSIVGSYMLRAVNGNNLPAPLSAGLVGLLTATSGTLTLGADSTYKWTICGPTNELFVASAICGGAGYQSVSYNALWWETTSFGGLLFQPIGDSAQTYAPQPGAYMNGKVSVPFGYGVAGPVYFFTFVKL
jgi:hypothetical protein